MDIQYTAFVQSGFLYLDGTASLPLGEIPVKWKKRVDLPDGTVPSEGNLHPVLVQALESARNPIMGQVKKGNMELAASSGVERRPARRWLREPTRRG